MILNLLFINIIVVLIFSSGFIDSVDEFIQKKFRFHHLPKPFSCALCTTFWVSVIFIFFTGNFSLLNLMLCLVSAHLTEITTPLITLIKNLLLKAIELINEVLY